MKLKIFITAFILAVSLAGLTTLPAESAERILPPIPPVTGILLAVSSDFIIANERKFTINSKTDIRNKLGQKISYRLLKKKSKIYIEYSIQTIDKKNVPVAGIIKVLSEP